MIHIRHRSATKLVGGLLGVVCVFTGASGQVPEKEKVIAAAERAFNKVAKTNPILAPGCAVGISLNGESIFEKAFGLAEMEHKVPNTAQTIFESGSVAKQFTAAALVLLEQDGKLKIDDDVRKYIPELPNYGKAITIRHLLTHTAGVRDWGSVMALTGAGRGNRVITQDLAFDVVIRQKSLDFVPGAEYSYSNGGYQLAAIIVERVSKQKFADFTRERIFKPLGMDNTSWREDFRRLVPGRAQAYSRSGPNSPWILSMPIMNVIGNGGMLTTVGDWLKWTAALDAKTLGPAFVSALETPAVLNDGRKIRYGLGMGLDEYRGLRSVGHGGQTAGYQTFLVRFPEKKLSIAVLCNGPFTPSTLATGIVDEILGPQPASALPQAMSVTVDKLQKYTGIWIDETTRTPVTIAINDGILTLNGEPLRPAAEGVFTYARSKVEFAENKQGELEGRETDENGRVFRFYRKPEWKPAATDLAGIAGDWYSEEAQATFTFVVEGENVFVTQRPSLKMPLKPVYKDHFVAAGYAIWLDRDASGKVTGIHFGGSRMRDMPFRRVR